MNKTSQSDQAARQRALDPHTSFIVQAPAGSGKTSLLVQRMLMLLAKEQHPQSILAITFTRKAASEMRARLWQELNSAQQEISRAGEPSAGEISRTGETSQPAGVSLASDQQHDSQQHDSQQSDYQQHDSQQSDYQRHDSQQSDYQQHDSQQSDYQQHDYQQHDYQQLTRQLALKVLEKDQKHGWQLLKAPWRIRVQTMDAYWNDLIRQAPLEAKLTGEETLLKNARHIYGKAARRLLARAEEDSPLALALKTMVRRCQNRHSQCEEQLVELLEKREQLLSLVNASSAGDSSKNKSAGDSSKNKSAGVQSEPFLSKLESVLQEVILARIRLGQQKLTEVLSPAEIDSLMGLLSEAGKNVPADSPYKVLASVEELPAVEISALATWRAIAQMLMVQDKDEFRKKPNKKQGFLPAEEATETNKAAKLAMVEFLEHLQENDATNPSGIGSLRQKLSDIRDACQPTLPAWEREAVTALQQVLGAALASLKKEFEDARAVDYTEIMLVAQRCLRSGSHAEQRNLRHLLVDEFQDTSIAQFDLLASLVAGWSADSQRTLFLVGDPMQSIYRFRKAETGLFVRAMTEGLANIKLETITLHNNFRSRPELVQWHNHAFKKIFPTQTSLLDGATAYVWSKATRQKSEQTAVQHYLLPDSTAEADKVATWLKKALLAQPQCRAAVLFRANKKVQDILRALAQHQVPFQYEQRTTLAEQQEVLDLLALLRALLVREDTLAWFSVLRAPWCGFSLASLTLLAEKLGVNTGTNAWANVGTNVGATQETQAPDESQSIDESIEPVDRPAEQPVDRPVDRPAVQSAQANCSGILVWQVLGQADFKAQLSLPEQTALTRLQTTFEWAWQGQGQLATAAWLEKTWLRLGGPACLTQSGSLANVNLFLEQLAQISLAETPDFFGYLMECLKDAPSNEYPLETAGKVAVMSIHKAKGLEFDVVVLPNLESKSASDSTKMFCWEEYPASTGNKPHLLLAATPTTGDFTENSTNSTHSTLSFIQKFAKRKDQMERARLLYVGCTRAREKLLLTASHSAQTVNSAQTDQKVKSFQTQSFLHLLWDSGAIAKRSDPLASELPNPRITESGSAESSSAESSSAESSSAESSSAEASNKSASEILINGESAQRGWLWRLPQNWQPPEPQKDVPAQGVPLTEEQLSGAISPGAEDGTEDGATEDGAEDGTTEDGVMSPASTQSFNSAVWQPQSLVPRLVGIETHRWLEVLAQHDPASWHQVVEQAKQCVKANLSQLGSPLSALDQAAQVVLKALAGTISDEQGRWLLQQHQSSNSEIRLDHFSIDKPDQYQVYQSIIDRTFVSEDNIRWIVDFKTTSTQQKDPQAFLLAQKEKYKDQLERYAKLFKQLEPQRTIKVALYFPLLKILESWQFSALK